MPPAAEMDAEPLLDPKQVALADDTAAIAGDAWLAIVVDVVRLQPLASITMML